MLSVFDGLRLYQALIIYHKPNRRASNSSAIRTLVISVWVLGWNAFVIIEVDFSID